MSLKKKIQVYTVALPNATAAAKRTYDVTLDSNYKYCRGFYAIVNKGTEYLRAGVRSAEGDDIVTPVNLNHMVVSTAVKIADRFYVSPFEAKGKTITISVENFAVTAAEQNVDFIFLLDNEEPK